MTKIENEMQYSAALKRVEELMELLPEETPEDDPLMVELTLLGNLVADYDEEHYPIEAPQYRPGNSARGVSSLFATGKL